MRWSLSTRIFLAFALVITCSGSASIYAVASVASLRHELSFLRSRALPLLEALRKATAELRAFDEALQRAAPQDLDWVVRLLPNARPYPRVDAILGQTRQAAQRSEPPALARWVTPPRPALTDLEKGLVALRQSSGARTRVAADAALVKATGPLDPALRDAGVYDVLAQALQRAIADRRLDDAARLVVELRRMIRHIHGGLEQTERQLEQRLSQRFEQAGQAEGRLLWVVMVTAGLSLLVSVLMLAVSVLALRPLAALTGLVRRFAGGERRVRAATRGAAEIATLAAEWNRMADALAERETQLFAQRDELARAERLAALGQVAARMAHEVRNPLSSIGLNAELLGEELQRPAGVDRDEARELLAAIGAEVERLRELTEGYLARGRPAPPQLGAVQPARLVRELAVFLEPELQRRGIHSELALDDTAVVTGDAGALRQALWNLVRNAWEAAGQGGTVWLEVTRETRTGADGAAVSGVVIAVEDSGPGVPEALHARIFEPFFSNKDRGTGIGLAVVGEILRQHHGTATLEAARHGHGARFAMWIPQQAAVAALSSQDIDMQ